jgi:hypothetical protein
MTTLTELSEQISRQLRDIDNRTFGPLTLRDLINDGIIEVNRVAPKEMTDIIVPLANTYEYPTDVTEGRRLELWDATTTPPTVVARVVPASENPVVTSNSGWELWAGKLRIGYGTLSQITIAQHELYLWGWGKRALLSDLLDVLDASDEAEQAIREYATFAGYERLMADRSLFTQWQTYASNSDVSPTQMGNMTSYWERRWHDRRRQIKVMRFPV